MKQVLRYEIPNGVTEVAFDMPALAKAIHFDYQSDRNTFSVWAEVNPKETITEIKRFKVVGTGPMFELPDTAQHVGSVVMPDGFHIWHLYEL